MRTICRVVSSVFGVACLTASHARCETIDAFSVKEEPERLTISLHGAAVAEFLFRHEQIRRPCFANIRVPNGLKVTRNHPPISGSDDTDHETMHPGIWLGFGDVSGNDFWRNKSRIEHLRFTEPPRTESGTLTFSTESNLLTADERPLCRLNCRFILEARPVGWLLIWDATFHADTNDVTFGDQEEMGFGARVATPLAEKNGGRILNSEGLMTAARTWGQAAQWCDYSGSAGDRDGGITLMAAPSNFRESWWHTRDYGVFVANPFGREAMKQGNRSSIVVKQGESLRLVFGALLHNGVEVDSGSEYLRFTSLISVGTAQSSRPSRNSLASGRQVAFAVPSALQVNDATPLP